MEKLVKAVESLKLLETMKEPSSSSSEKASARVREKISHCLTISTALTSPALLSKVSTADFSRSLTVSMESLIALLDDADLDVRTTAEESVNRVVNALRDTHSGRLQVELYKEIKKNGSPRCLTAALARFSHLASLIRPQKCRAFVVNLVPPLVKIARRKEEAVQQALADAATKIFAALGKFTQESEVRLLVKTCVPNLFDASASVRRSAAATVAAVAALCSGGSGGAESDFLLWTLSTLLDFLVPVNVDGEKGNASRIVGVLLCAKSLVVRIYERPAVASGDDAAILLQRLVQLYELCLHYIGSTEHTVVVQALETLQQLLRTPPKCLRSVLLSPSGIKRSHVFFKQSGALPLVDENAAEEEEEERRMLHDLEAASASEEEAAAREHRGRIQIKEDSIQEEDDGDEVEAEEKSAGEAGATIHPAAKFEGQENADKAGREEKVLEGIGSFCDADLPIIYCARKITLSFLLTR